MTDSNLKARPQTVGGPDLVENLGLEMEGTPVTRFLQRVGRSNGPVGAYNLFDIVVMSYSIMIDLIGSDRQR